MERPSRPRFGPASPAVLMPQVYYELRRLAANYLRRERPGQTLQATALVHEAFLRLNAAKNHPWKNRTHFLAIAALSMRQILVQRARARHAEKRGGQFEITSLRTGFDIAADADELTSISEVLDELAEVDERLARIVDLKFFCGFSFLEIAGMLEISERTVQRDWEKARIYLHQRLRSNLGPA